MNKWEHKWIINKTIFYLQPHLIDYYLPVSAHLPPTINKTPSFIQFQSPCAYHLPIHHLHRSENESGYIFNAFIFSIYLLFFSLVTGDLSLLSSLFYKHLFHIILLFTCVAGYTGKPDFGLDCEPFAHGNLYNCYVFTRIPSDPAEKTEKSAYFSFSPKKHAFTQKYFLCILHVQFLPQYIVVVIIIYNE